jgi:alcohol dehydrogenase class IV
MSVTWRERLRERRREIGIEGPEHDYIQRYIESFYSEADRLCKKIGMNKTVDEVIDSMKDEKFDKFTKGVIGSIHKKRGYDPDDDSKKEITISN